MTTTLDLVIHNPKAQAAWGYTRETAATTASVINKAIWRAFSYLPWSEQITYWTSLTYRQVRTTLDPEGNPWWNEITENIFLGGIPLNNWDHLALLVNEVGVKAILTMNKPFELNRSGFLIAENEPVTPEQWKKGGITQLIIPAEDMVPLSLEEAHQAAEFIDSQVRAGNRVYAHCKAGVGRSPTAVMCYLMRFQKMTPAQAFEYVNRRRPTINLNSEQKEFLTIFYQSIRKETSNGN